MLNGLRAAAIAVSCLITINSYAATVSISTDAPVERGTVFTAFVTIDGVNDLALEAWDLTVFFDGDVFDFGDTFELTEEQDVRHGSGLTDSGNFLIGPFFNSPERGIAKVAGSTISGIIPADMSVLLELSFSVLTDAADGFSLMEVELIANETVELRGSGEIQVTAVPVPAAVWLMASALCGLFGFRRKFAA